MSADSALRANIRLLGDLLGQVLVEQEGDSLLELVERIRQLARDARAGDGAAFAELGQAVTMLPLELQALVLRAFALYFQLALLTNCRTGKICLSAGKHNATLCCYNFIAPSSFLLNSNV